MSSNRALFSEHLFTQPSPGALATQHQQFYPMNCSLKVWPSTGCTSQFPLNQVLVEDLGDRSCNKMMTVEDDDHMKVLKNWRHQNSVNIFHTTAFSTWCIQSEGFILDTTTSTCQVYKLSCIVSVLRLIIQQWVLSSSDYKHLLLQRLQTPMGVYK